MCGRFGIDYELPGLADYFEFDPADVADAYASRLNIAPTSDVLVVRTARSDGAVESARDAMMMRWGLIPHWTRPDALPKRPLFNARAETIDERPTFRVPFARSRCLIPAGCFYEWTASADGARVPMRIAPEGDGTPIAFAGIWSAWNGPDGWVRSCSIITTAANEFISPIHHRMPVILDRDVHEVWLDGETEPEVLRSLIQPREWEGMAIEPANPATFKRREKSGSDGAGQSTLL